MKKLLIILFILTICICTVVGQIPVMTMRTGKNMVETFAIFSFILKANAPNTQIQVDFGDGTLVNKIIDTSQTAITDTLLGYLTIRIYGTGITYLACNYHQINFMDVTQNPTLTYLDCYNTNLTTLDVTQNPALTYLYCSMTHLQALDVTNNPVLTFLSCWGTNLTTLDLTKNPSLQYLDCRSHLTTLDVTHNIVLTQLYCANSLLTTFDITKNPSLQYLDCSSNQLTAIDVTQNTALQYFYCSINRIKGLDATINIALQYLYCSNNQLITLDITKNIALQFLYCDFNQLYDLDLTHSSVLSSLVLSNNKFTFATLPLRTSWAVFGYAPQKEISIGKTLAPGVELDLSSQLNVWGYTTVYTWKTQGGISLIEGIDYTINNGKTIFLKAQPDSVYCKMTNAYFPYFDAFRMDGLKTTNTMITSIITGIEEVGAPILEIYAHDKSIHINLSYNAQLSIFDLSGRLIIFKPIYSGINSLQLSKTGVYLVKIINKKDAIFRKVLVE